MDQTGTNKELSDLHQTLDICNDRSAALCKMYDISHLLRDELLKMGGLAGVDDTHLNAAIAAAQDLSFHLIMAACAFGDLSRDTIQVLYPDPSNK